MFLHTFQPESILLAIGPIKIYWYGLTAVTGMLAGMAVFFKLAKKEGLDQDQMIDLVFWLVVFGLIGARLYHVLLESEYYFSHPAEVIKIWQGGLAIHGGILAGVITIWFFVRKHKLDFWLISSLLAPAIALGQAIGRWGNYFNQELFGRPTGLPWGIPISIFNRPAEYISDVYFHPAFLYESLGDLLIFFLLLIIYCKIGKNHKLKAAYSVMAYLFSYSLLRFSMEFIRVDATPGILGIRFPQALSAIIALLSMAYCLFMWNRNKIEQAGDLPKS
jgi:phosphatidylglycerol---prolipoprotein diacylglyceryl transferase